MIFFFKLYHRLSIVFHWGYSRRLIILNDICFKIYRRLSIVRFLCSSRSRPHQDGAQHSGRRGAPLHRKAALRVPDGGETLPHPGLPQGRRSLYQAVQRGGKKNDHEKIRISFILSTWDHFDWKLPKISTGNNFLKGKGSSISWRNGGLQLIT